MQPDLIQVNSHGIPELSVVIPVYNECHLIEGVLTTWSEHLREAGIHYEFVVVNDGSMDGTSRVLDRLRQTLPQLRVVHQLNTGHGRAIRRGYEVARGQFILQLDANGTSEPVDFDRFWTERFTAKLILGHRTHRLDSFLRRVFSHYLRFVSQFLFGVKLNDPNVSFRLLDRSVIANFVLPLPRHWDSVNLAMAVAANKSNSAEVLEIKVPHRKRAMGSSHLKISDLIFLGMRYFGEQWELRKILKTSSPTLRNPAAPIRVGLTPNEA